MTEIQKAILPKDNRGNDPNDFCDVKNYLQKLNPKTLESKSGIPASPTMPDTEDDVGLLFTSLNRDKLRYVAMWGKWLRWDGRVWKQDLVLGVFDMIRRLCREVFSSDSKMRAKMMNAGTISAIERLVRSDPIHASTVDQWDADDWLLNTSSGIVDLSSGEIKPHDPDRHCTKLISVGPCDECPGWNKFLSEITNNDQELIGFIQRMIGYACTGSTKEHALFFFYGIGGNGKGTLLNTVLNILNDYAVIASMDVFTNSTHDRHPTELAALMGARLVIAQETDEGRKWAEAKIKTLTGGDPITARFMRQDFFTYLPKFTLIIAGNHKPSIQTVDEAIRRRLHLVPFNVTIAKEKRDPDLAEKLCKESGGILQWMIDGCLEYQKQGLNPPKSVIEATESYFEDENSLQQWVIDKCETGLDFWETPTILFNSWKIFATAGNLFPGTSKDFKDKLESAGYRFSKTGQRGRHFRGIRVKPDINPGFSGEPW